MGQTNILIMIHNDNDTDNDNDINTKQDPSLTTIEFDKVENDGSFLDFIGCNNVSEQYKESITILNKILDVVANRYGFDQYGAKSWQTYYEHAINGVHQIVQLQHVIFDPLPSHDPRSLTFFKTLCVSYLIHDINKFKWITKEGNELWSAETVTKELDDINALTDGLLIDEFFTDWKSHVNDMITLIRGHSVIHNHLGRALVSGNDEWIPLSLKTMFNKEELKRGIDVMQLVDIIDLIHDLSADKVTFIGYDEHGHDKKCLINQQTLIKRIEDRLSRLARVQIKLETVRVTMNVSKFTNVMLNSIVTVLRRKLEMTPLLVFTNGFYVFGHRQVMDELMSDVDKIPTIKEAVASEFVRTIDDLMMSRITDDKFLYDITGQGIKIKDYAFQKPNEKHKMKTILEYLARTLPPFKYDPRKPKVSSRYKIFHDVTSKKKKVNKMDTFLSREIQEREPMIRKWENGDNTDLLENDELWKMARFAHTVFVNILKLHERSGNTKIDQCSIMREFLESMNVFDDLASVYDKSDRNSYFYRFAFFQFVGDALYSKGMTMDDIAPLLITYMMTKMDELTIDEHSIPDPLSFVNDHVHLFNEGVSSTDLIRPSDAMNVSTCSACGTQLKHVGSLNKDREHYKWRSQYVSDGISVQKFSNMLIAGESKQPTRMVCTACKWRFYLDKILAIVSGKGIDSFFPTFYFKKGKPFEMIMGIQSALERLKDDPDARAFRIDLRTFASDRSWKINVKTNKGYGFSLPRIPNEICGSIPITWRIKNDKSLTVQYWDVLINTLIMTIKLNLKVTLSRLKNDHENMLGTNSVLLHDVPSEFSWFLHGKRTLTRDEARLIVDMMQLIEETVKNVLNKDGKKMKDYQKYCIEFLRCVNINVLNGFNFLDASLRDNKNIKEASHMYVRELITDHVNHMYELKQQIGGMINMASTSRETKTVSIIQQMGELKLTGQGYSDHQKARAIDVVFGEIKLAHGKARIDDILASASHKIMIFLDNDAKQRGYHVGKKTIEKIEKFMELFNELLHVEYNGILQTMYRNRFNIRSAYICYVDTAIRKRSDEKKNGENHDD